MHNKFPRIALLLGVLFVAVTASAQPSRPLVQELKRLGVNTVLLRQASIDDWPLWSPDGRFVCINESGNWWLKVDLDATSLSPATWLGREVGNNYVETTEVLTPEEREQYTKSTKYDPRTITTSKGVRIDLVMENDFGVSLLINSKRIWKTGGDNCHSLSLSPDEKYVAFISESNGLVLMDIADSYKSAQLSAEATEMNSILNLLYKGKMTKALKQVSAATEKYPGYAEFWYTKGVIFFAQGNLELAHKYNDSALARAPENFNYVYFHVILYQAEEKYDSALVWIGKYIAMRPYCLYGYYTRAELYEKKGDRQAACADYIEAEARHSRRAIAKRKSTCD